MGFNNPIVGAVNLIRQAIQSPNFVTGVSGWAIKKDGTAEFRGATVGGGIVTGELEANLVLIDGSSLAPTFPTYTQYLILDLPGSRQFQLLYDTGTGHVQVYVLSTSVNFSQGPGFETTPVDVRNGEMPMLYGETGVQSFTLTAANRVGITVNLANTQPNATYMVQGTVKIGSNFDVLFNLQSQTTTSFTGTLFTKGGAAITASGSLHWQVTQQLT